jgi:hypothetical protein
MIRRIGTATLVLAFLFAAAPAFAKDEEPTLSEKAEDYAKDFKKRLKKMTSAEVMEGVDQLVAYYVNEKVDDKGAKKAILDGLAKSTGVRDKTVVAHTMKKVADIGEDSVKLVLPTLNRELAQKAPDENVYETALGTLRKIASENKLVIKTLTKLLKDKENEIVGLAARTISGYEKASGRTRKELFEEVLKAVEGVYSGAQSQNQTLERKWNVIGDDAVDALSKLAHVKLADPAVARKWFNDNKKKNWDPQPEKD